MPNTERIVTMEALSRYDGKSKALMSSKDAAALAQAKENSDAIIKGRMYSIGFGEADLLSVASYLRVACPLPACQCFFVGMDLSVAVQADSTLSITANVGTALKRFPVTFYSNKWDKDYGTSVRYRAYYLFALDYATGSIRAYDCGDSASQAIGIDPLTMIGEPDFSQSIDPEAGYVSSVEVRMTVNGVTVPLDGSGSVKVRFESGLSPSLPA